MDYQNMFGEQPSYIGGLLGADEADKLKKQSFSTGITNALLGYMAQPKNQNYGSALPYLAKSFIAGQQGAQGVYDDAIGQYQTKFKIDEMKRKQEQQAKLQTMLGGITDPNEQLFAQLAPEEYVRGKLTKKDRKTVTVGNVVLDAETMQPVYVGEKDLKAPPTRERQIGRMKIQEQMNPDGSWSIIGKGSMDAPNKPTEATYTPKQGADGKLYYVPNKPTSPVFDANGKPTNEFKFPADASTKVDESQRATLSYHARMVDAENALKGYSVSDQKQGVGEAVLGVGGEVASNFGRSPKRQQALQSQRAWVRAKLRKESGASIPEPEMAQEIATFFPMPNDDAETVAMKERARKTATDSMMLGMPDTPTVNREVYLGKNDLMPNNEKVIDFAQLPKNKKQR